MKLFRKKIIAWILIVLMISETILPTASLAGGPSMPEVQSFTAYNATDLVDPFSGDFSYNLPLLNVGGYPINLSYSSGVGMEDEASMVGLGWNLNTGAINRNVRGLPDDFSGEKIKREFNLRDNETMGVNTGVDLEIYGWESGQVGLGIQLGYSNNTYNGFNVNFGLTPSIASNAGGGDAILSGSLSSTFSMDSESGLGIQPTIGFKMKAKGNENYSKFGAKMGLDWNASKGLKKVFYGLSYDRAWHKEGKPKKVIGNGGIGWKFPCSYAHPTYTPSFDLPMDNFSASLNLKVGLEGFGVLGGLSGGGFYSKQYLKSNEDSISAYGYIYSENAGGGRVLMDINREKDGPYQEDLPNLPLTNFAYDVFNVNAQGFGGTFRPFRGDVGTVHDPYYSSNAISEEGGEGGVDVTGVSVGGEVGVGNLFHAGVDVTVTLTGDQSGKWKNGNSAKEEFAFVGKSNDKPLYEPVYFKNVGEKNVLANSDLFNTLGGTEPVAFQIDEDEAKAILINPDKGISNNVEGQDLLKTTRESRNTSFSFLTAEEANEIGLDKKIKSFDNEFTPLFNIREGAFELSFERPSIKFDRVDEVRKKHHISEISVGRDDGTRYVFGLPAYNQTSKEVSFNVSGDPTGDGVRSERVLNSNGYFVYSAGDNTIRNNNGKDHYFKSTETPPHAYAYLLSAVLSDDYVDLTNDGPSADDFGSYTKFNYQRFYSDFKWRMPYGVREASFNPVHLSDKADDLASFQFGSKEIWHTHSIESKNYVAEFHYSDREDVFESAGEDGGVGERALKKLDRIDLYNKVSRLKLGDEAEPIQSVRFNYDYSLCEGSPQNPSGKGKLTLKSVVISHGDSEKEMLSPYLFNYAQNPNYSANSSDRWGSFKPKDVDDKHKRDVYSERSTAIADINAAAWALTRVHLPSGGELNIEYEADRYSFVQDKRAMEMVEIIDFGRSNSSHNPDRPAPTEARLYNASGASIPSINNFLFFKLKNRIEGEEKLREYVDGIDELYFNCLVDVAGREGDNFEAVSGFIPVDFETFEEDFGYVNNEIGWLKLPIVNRYGDDFVVEPGSENAAHPIAKSCWAKLKKSLHHLAHDNPDPEIEDDLTQFLAGFERLGDQIISLTKNFNEKMEEKQKGDKIQLKFSYVRLNSPDKNKIGGGSRVKRIYVNDKWGEMTTAPEIPSFQYGKEYFYDEEEEFDGGTRTVSTGVAAYEPLIGADENPFVRPSRYVIHKTWATDVNEYIIEPFGQMFFPSARVGYSKIRVRNLKHTDVNRTATGFVQHEFYTAKDFPTLTKQTRIFLESGKFIAPPFYSKKSVTVSQGYVVELNDMHGKKRSEKNFSEFDSENPISGIDYIYKTDPDNPARLDNSTQVIDPVSGIISEQTVGLEYDFVVDARQMCAESQGPGAQINTDGFMAAIFPVIVPMIYPEYSYALKQYSGITATKVIQRSGLIERVINYDLGSELAAENVLYDAQTGEVLITKSEDEYDLNRFRTSIPAHWVYSGMDASSKNEGLELFNQRIRNGQLRINSAEDFFQRADELMLTRLDSSMEVRSPGGSVLTTSPLPATKAWVYEVNDNNIQIIDRLGNRVPNGRYDLKIIRSGKRNLQSQEVASISTLEDPINSEGQLEFKKVTNSIANEFDEQWQTYAGFKIPLPEESCVCEPLSGDFNTRSTFLGAAALVGQLLSSQDYDAVNAVLGEDYLAHQGFMDYMLGSGDKTYQATKNGKRVDAFITNTATGGEVSSCEMNFIMEDGTPFPDSITRVENLQIWKHPTVCEDLYGLTMDIVFPDGEGRSQTKTVEWSSNCVTFFNCELSVGELPPTVCGLRSGEQVNPFLLGILGNWRPMNSFYLNTNRVYNVRGRKGFLEEFSNFHELRNFEAIPAVDKSKWSKRDLATVIDPYNKQLQVVDMMNVPVSELYGFNYSLPAAQVSNASYKDVAFDSFEDYDYRSALESPFEDCPLPAHFRFPLDEVEIDDKVSHSGKRSLVVQGSEKIERDLRLICDGDKGPLNEGTFLIRDCDLISRFSPSGGNYNVSAWVKQTSIGFDVETSFSNTSIIIDVDGTTRRFRPSGKIVDGWQQISGDFEIPDGARNFKMTLVSNASKSWFDDLRIQPENATMETYVYNPENLRLMAVLDQDNYGVFYEYDRSGQLARKKVETDNGVVTLNEFKSAKPKR